jgi:hypothetical protein
MLGLGSWLEPGALAGLFFCLRHLHAALRAPLRRVTKPPAPTRTLPPLIDLRGRPQLRWPKSIRRPLCAAKANLRVEQRSRIQNGRTAMSDWHASC